MSAPPPLALNQAQARLTGACETLGTETVPILDGVGRYLAEPLMAKRTQPAADLSSMDGFATRGESGSWRIVGESAAGLPFVGELAEGEAVRISTGAIMPARAEAVLSQENARREGNMLASKGKDGSTVRHIRRAGLDFSVGDPLLEEGSVVGPAQLALAIAAGHKDLLVGRRPTVAIIDSGDELATDPDNLAPHLVPASNGPMLAALI